jgi:hypothetical protein
MEEYRENVTTVEGTGLLASLASSSEDLGPRYMSLGQQYGLSDDMEIGRSGSRCQATIEQEYQAYITAPLSLQSVDILKFWEVSYMAWNLDPRIYNVLIFR